ncbi:mannose-6-phosphate isomerase-like protein (cupin superfamily) [Arcicella aurantiaca]|uniref:Mannose-6-phosphate isomerase-like protein (Cupin superfamily) n=1 Tax=Arcicella aurantiaca TaxID=591202 RepID=A0A316DWF1_9BACT|nr:phosphoheptose isomerase [Arcicella aurantiaca]PWK21652.1 mannose-6-phosphate isomerase-like protein (cupin superfamily) [Arcicella aurantiaca]
MIITTELKRDEIFTNVKSYILSEGFVIANEDLSRPWGGFLVIDETQTSKFINLFFPELSVENFKGFEKLSPKILLVAPTKRLSWQYHFRRSEIWTLIGGNAAIVRSDNDVEKEVKNLELNIPVTLKQGERHRLIGVEEWGVVAEIWQHTDINNPSDEEDIVRIQDDFGR